eukprot:2481713-Amphidinium_carterae.1
MVVSSVHEALEELRQSRKVKICSLYTLQSGLVTILCHVECLGAWTSLWEPCRKWWPFAATFNASYLGENSELEGRGTIFDVELVSRREICSWRWQMDGKACIEAVTEHLVWILCPKLVHYIFTMPTFRVVRVRMGGKGMTLVSTNVLLTFLWLV